MGENVKALNVILDRDYDEDNIEALISAISQLKKVYLVKKDLAKEADFIAAVRAEHQLRTKLIRFITKL